MINEQLGKTKKLAGNAKSRKRSRGSRRSRGSYRILRSNRSKSHASTHGKEGNLRGHYDEQSSLSSRSSFLRRHRRSHNSFVAGFATEFSSRLGEFMDPPWQTKRLGETGNHNLSHETTYYLGCSLSCAISLVTKARHAVPTRQGRLSTRDTSRIGSVCNEDTNEKSQIRNSRRTIGELERSL